LITVSFTSWNDATDIDTDRHGSDGWQLKKKLERTCILIPILIPLRLVGWEQCCNVRVALSAAEALEM
jgi:hypothetical protein